MANFKVFILLAGMTALFGAIGGAIGGAQGALLALLIAVAMNVYAWFNSATSVLKAYQARTVTREQAPELVGIVDRLRQKAGLPMPTVAIAPHQQPNAFATGRNADHAVVCATEGILQILDRDELEGVIGHELGHVLNKDMLLQTVSSSLSGAITSLSRFGMRSRNNSIGPLAVIFAPIAAMVLQFAISRSREYKADATGARISGKPLALASALRKLQAGAEQIPMHVSPAVAPLAQVNPLSAFGGGLSRMFGTHPDTEERIRRLEEIARQMGQME